MEKTFHAPKITSISVSEKTFDHLRTNSSWNNIGKKRDDDGWAGVYACTIEWYQKDIRHSNKLENILDFLANGQ